MRKSLRGDVVGVEVRDVVGAEVRAEAEGRMRMRLRQRLRTQFQELSVRKMSSGWPLRCFLWRI